NTAKKNLKTWDVVRRDGVVCPANMNPPFTVGKKKFFLNTSSHKIFRRASVGLLAG
ncbi:unnamed protein product, partial [Dovyalis caffra]